jgi:hypothetical protein
MPLARQIFGPSRHPLSPFLLCMSIISIGQEFAVLGCPATLSSTFSTISAESEKPFSSRFRGMFRQFEILEILRDFVKSLSLDRLVPEVQALQGSLMQALQEKPSLQLQ